MSQNHLDTQSVNGSFQTFKSDEENPHDLDNNVEEMIEKPVINWENFKHYMITRFTDLFPTKQSMQAKRHLLNPLPGLRMIGFRQWLMILSAFLAWSWDAYDFFSISLNASQLAKDFDKTVKDITWGITVVLMLRSVGGFFFGYLGDKYGRKWPLIANLLCVCVLEIGTGFIKNYEQFLGVRAVFGIMLGGVYGNAAATALDDCPAEAKGFISGFLQQGYAFGYLLAVVFKRAIADNAKQKWRAMFWFGAGVCFLITCFRASLPETKLFLKQKEIERYNIEHGIYQKTFKEKAKASLKVYWLMIIYMVLLMAGFNFMSHGSQDLYPTLLTVRYNFSDNATTVTNCVANLGAITGGILIGHFSNFTGRRLAIIGCCICGGALIYPWAFIDNANINAGAFWLQFFVQGSWGVVPVYLSEMAPPDFRAFVVGIAYQLGNLASSASSTIETTIGEDFPMTSPNGQPIYDYAKVMAIFVGCVFAYVLLVTLFGPEPKPKIENNNNENENNEIDEDGNKIEDYELNEKVNHEEIYQVDSISNQGNSKAI
ncbi:Jen1 protein [Pichia kluyveri]|uniref:Jen1 protein n=1 Tax=Pichia kluyveri TaxID=36015 RepID=A0AAV5R1H1_PICKL|nr:Jen1 protein [Pichia kluyveri]